MEPQIKYVTTKDGVSIAYWTMGEDVPYVIPRLNNPTPNTHIAVKPKLGREGEPPPKT